MTDNSLKASSIRNCVFVGLTRAAEGNGPAMFVGEGTTMENLLIARLDLFTKRQLANIVKRNKAKIDAGQQL